MENLNKEEIASINETLERIGYNIPGKRFKTLSLKEYISGVKYYYCNYNDNCENVLTNRDKEIIENLYNVNKYEDLYSINRSKGIFILQFSGNYDYGEIRDGRCLNAVQIIDHSKRENKPKFSNFGRFIQACEAYELNNGERASNDYRGEINS